MDPGRNGERDFQGEKRSIETDAATTDPDARLYKTAVGQESRLCCMGHVLMDEAGSATGSRKAPQGSGLAVDATLTHATGTAEREAALVLLDRRTAGRAGGGRITLGADKAQIGRAHV